MSATFMVCSLGRISLKAVMPQICVSQKAGTIPEKPVNGNAKLTLRKVCLAIFRKQQSLSCRRKVRPKPAVSLSPQLTARPQRLKLLKLGERLPCRALRNLQHLPGLLIDDADAC